MRSIFVDSVAFHYDAEWARSDVDFCDGFSHAIDEFHTLYGTEAEVMDVDADTQSGVVTFTLTFSYSEYPASTRVAAHAENFADLVDRYCKEELAACQA